MELNKAMIMQLHDLEHLEGQAHLWNIGLSVKSQVLNKFLRYLFYYW